MPFNPANASTGKMLILSETEKAILNLVWFHSCKHPAYHTGVLLSPSSLTDMETCDMLSVLRLHWLQLFIQHDILVSSYPRASTLVCNSLIPRPHRRKSGNEATLDII